MNCKHKKIIRIIDNNRAEFYCSAKEKEIKEWECENCLLKLEENPYQDFINMLFGGFKHE